VLHKPRRRRAFMRPSYRIKIMAMLDIVDRRPPQDGRIARSSR
jgi:type II secretory ATPase GspE/PulE/Tfp pilus assembly ATPase PilB-like protein